VSSPRVLDNKMMDLLTVSVFAGAGTIHYQTPMLAAFAADGDGEAKMPKGNPLCDFHAALGEVTADALAQDQADVLEAQVAAGVGRHQQFAEQA